MATGVVHHRLLHPKVVEEDKVLLMLSTIAEAACLAAVLEVPVAAVVASIISHIWVEAVMECLQ